MSETFDPLDLLREYITKDGSIHLSNKGDQKTLNFENYQNTTIKLPLDTPTAWKIKNSKGYYTLGSIWCAVTHRNLKGGEQQRKFQEIGVPVVNFLDVKELAAYLTG